MIRLLVAGLLTILLTGCSTVSFQPAANTADAETPETASSAAAPSEPPTPTPTPTPSPSYSQASGAGPAVNLELPVMPEVARQETADGLLAFVDHWFGLVNYAYQTGDIGPLQAVTTPECGVCRGVYETGPGAYADGGWLEGGQVEYENPETVFVLTTENRRQAVMSVRQRVIIHRDSSGKSVKVVAGTDNPFQMILEATYTGDGWFVDTAEPTGWPG
ncbi:DUF6318 family protein [Arthrobacter citreus]|uniref:DUF6318 family protein n=1 Tax=Arthrobacter citreus TaxID=1670 RepID=UPI0037FCD26C